MVRGVEVNANWVLIEEGVIEFNTGSMVVESFSECGACFTNILYRASLTLNEVDKVRGVASKMRLKVVGVVVGCTSVCGCGTDARTRQASGQMTRLAKECLFQGGFKLVIMKGVRVFFRGEKTSFWRESIGDKKISD